MQSFLVSGHAEEREAFAESIYSFWPVLIFICYLTEFLKMQWNKPIYFYSLFRRVCLSDVVRVLRMAWWKTQSM